MSQHLLDDTQLYELKEHLQKQLIGQNEAIEFLITNLLRSSGEAALSYPLMFAGPHGVGKRSMARQFTDFIYGTDLLLFDLDMADFQNKTQLSQLLGSIGGLGSHRSEGVLTSFVRSHPHCVLLLNRIDQAHHMFFRVLRTICTDGYLVDGWGRKVDFRNVTLITTWEPSPTVWMRFLPNLSRRGGFDYDIYRNLIQAFVHQSFPEEWVESLGEIIVFRPLTDPELEQILDRELDRYTQRLSKRGFTLEVSPNARKLLIHESRGIDTGATSLTEAVKSCLEEPLSLYLERSVFKPGSTITALRSEINTNKIAFRSA